MSKRLIYLFLFLLPFWNWAQDAPPRKVYFTGLGRALVAHDALDGKALQNDTATPNRGTEGYALFDMGVHIQPYDYLRGKALLRLKSTFGSFYGQGTSVELRQLLIEGLIAKKVKYALGDIDVTMTPYTVFNWIDSSEAFEADIFKLRRDIVYYENFNVGNNWRVQGAKATSTLLISKTPTKIKFDLFASRTRVTNNYSQPDRFLVGGSMNVFVFKGLNIGGNYVRFFELDKQVNNQTTFYSNDVLTGTLSCAFNTPYLLFRLKGETGASFFNRSLYQTTPSSDSSVYKKGFFFDLRWETEIKPAKLKLYVGNIITGSYFYSPAAQTIRIAPFRTPTIFPTLNNNTSTREALQYDRTTQEQLYTQTISPTLGGFLPSYGNALPYGEATPNRYNLAMGIVAGDNESLLQASARADLLRELRGEGTDLLRHFFLARAGTHFRIHKLWGSDRWLILSTGGKFETTNRNAPSTILLQTKQLDLGLTIETIRNLDLLVGYKSIYSSGNEFFAYRDAFNNITSYFVYLVDFTQQTKSLGIRYRFSDKSFFTVNANFTENENRLNLANTSYRFSQYFVAYNLAF